jgi:hypothetical protein
VLAHRDGPLLLIDKDDAEALLMWNTLLCQELRMHRYMKRHTTPTLARSFCIIIVVPSATASVF